MTLKILLIPVLLLAGGAILLLLASCSAKPPRTELVNGHLRPCPGTPNCVSSEAPAETPAYIAPFRFTGNSDEAWARLGEVISEAGGTLKREEPEFLWATFTTPIMRFVDDVECRLDRERGVIHIRSASRIGKSDLGTNRKRVESLRQLYTAR